MFHFSNVVPLCAETEVPAVMSAPLSALSTPKLVTSEAVPSSAAMAGFISNLDDQI